VHLPLHRVAPRLRDDDLFLADYLFCHGSLLSPRMIPPLRFWHSEKIPRQLTWAG
jgi:hypothetical protein